MKIVASNGKWFQSQAKYVLVDPTNGTRFEPGVATKAEDTEWVKAQPAIPAIADPLAPAPAPVAPVKK